LAVFTSSGAEQQRHAFTLLLCFGFRIRMCIHAKQVGSFNNHWQSDDREQQQRRIGPRKQQAILTVTTNLAQNNRMYFGPGSKNVSQQRDEDYAGEQMKKLIDASAQRQQPRISCGSKQQRVGQPQELLINDVDFWRPSRHLWLSRGWTATATERRRRTNGRR
jgi:hypothetical protein